MRSRSLIVSMVVTLLSACPPPVESCDGGCDGGSSSELSNYCTEQALAHCAASKVCGSAIVEATCAQLAGVKESEYPKLFEHCVDLERALVQKGTLTFDAVAAKRCTDARKNATVCTEAFTDPSCANVFVGSAGVGQACSFNVECSSSLWCDTSVACPGACRAKLPVGGVVPRQPAGFSYDSACEGAYVDVFGSDAGVSCLAPAAHGESCDHSPGGSYSVGGQLCADPADSCDFAGTKRCVTTPVVVHQWVKRGERCDDSAGFQCAAGLACRYEASDAGVCGEALAQGESCSRSLAGCGAGLRCDSSTDSTCRPPLTAGQSCTSDGLCGVGLRCGADHTCVARPALGERCASTPECYWPADCVAGTCQLRITCQ